MWLVNFLPEWFFQAILIGGFLGILVSRFVPTFYKTLVLSISLLLVCLGIFVMGSLHERKAWIAKVKEMEVQVAEAEAKSSKENIKIVEKIVYRDRIIRQKGEDIVKYIDREIVKYNETCKVPKEVVDVLNMAAESKK